jgi:hypothetical protein
LATRGDPAVPPKPPTLAVPVALAGAAGPGSRSNLSGALLNRRSGGKGRGREPARDAPGIDVLGVHSGAAMQAGQCQRL